MAAERLSATLSIGSVLEGSIRRNVSVLRSGLDSVGDSIGKVARRQKELERNRKVLEREGRSVAELDREYEDLGRTLDALRRKQQRLEAVSRGVGRVGRDAALVGQDLKRMAVGTAAGVAAIGTAIFAVSSSTAALGDEVAKTSTRIGVGIAPLQELRYAAQRTGVDIDNLDEGLKEVQLRLADAKRGAGPAVEALKELGLSADTLARMRPEDAIGAIGDALLGVKNNGDQVFLVDALMGEDGVKMLNLLRQGSAGMQQLRRDARETGFVLSEKAARDAEVFQDRLLDTQLVMKGLKNTVGAELLPVISGAMSELSGWARTNQPEIRAWAKTLVGGLEAGLPIARDILRGVADVSGVVGRGVAQVADWVGGWRNLGVAIGVALGARTLGRVARLMGSVARLSGAVVRLAAGPALFSAATGRMATAASADFARTAASAEASGRRVAAARSGLFMKGGMAALMGGLALSQLPEGAEAQAAMQAQNREGIESVAKSTPVIREIMQAQKALIGLVRGEEAAQAWWDSFDGVPEKLDGVATSTDGVTTSTGDATRALGETPAAGEAFAGGMATVRAAAAETETVLLRSASAAEAVNRRFAELEASRRSAHLSAADTAALGRAHATATGPAPTARAGRVQARAAGGTFGMGPLLVGEEGPEVLWASRGGYVSSARELEGLRALARRTFADLRRVGGAGPAPAPAGGGGPLHLHFHAANMSPEDVMAVARREERKRARRALFDGPSGLGQYGGA